jgi:ribosomal protein S18 acetylase RimI-like enzyme
LSDDQLVASRAFVWPAALSSLGLERRPETDADLAFLVELFATTRREEFAPAGWPPEVLEAFLRSQFDAQRYHYRSVFLGCEFDVLELNGQPIGRLYLYPLGQSLDVVDIALMPLWRGRGFGGAVLTAIQEAAADLGRGVTIMVEQYNPARRLYDRLGFEIVADQGVYLEMLWRPKA